MSEPWATSCPIWAKSLHPCFFLFPILRFIMLAPEVMLASGVKDKKTAEAWCKDHPAEMDQIAWDAGPGENIGEIATLWWQNASANTSTMSSTGTEKREKLKRKRDGEENGAMVKEPVKRPANCEFSDIRLRHT